MPQQPERPIEKLLRASAKKRLEEARASFDLDPGTRQRLLAEVTRKFSSPVSKQRPWTQLLRWPRLAWSLAAAVALICGMWVLRPQSPNKTPQILIAQNRIETPVTPATPAASTDVLRESIRTQPDLRDQSTATPNEPSAPGSPPLTFSEDRTKDSSALSLRNSESLSAQAKSQMQPMEDLALAKKVVTPEAETHLSLAVAGAAKAPESSTPTAATSPAPALLDAGSAAVSVRGMLVAAAPSNSALAPSDGAVATELRDHFQTISQAQPSQFSIGRADSKAKLERSKSISPATPILTSFELTQQGRQLRVTDQDGSVYTGYLQSLPIQGVQVSTRRSVSGPVPAPPQAVASGSLVAGVSAPQTFIFDVSGTNITLNQRVVFSGKLIQPVLNEASDRAFAAGAWRLQPSAQALSAAKRVSGKALLGDKTEITIEAVSAPLDKKGN